MSRGGSPQEERETATSLEQARPKRNAVCAKGKPATLSPRNASGSQQDLFDRHREPPDQPCNLVEVGGIVLPDDLREPTQAFVIAHRGDVSGDDRGHRPDKFGLDWHRITSGEPGAIKPCQE
jgi:hypothetical protein